MTCRHARLHSIVGRDSAGASCNCAGVCCCRCGRRWKLGSGEVRISRSWRRTRQHSRAPTKSPPSPTCPHSTRKTPCAPQAMTPLHCTYSLSQPRRPGNMTMSQAQERKGRAGSTVEVSQSGSKPAMSAQYDGDTMRTTGNDLSALYMLPLPDVLSPGMLGTRPLGQHRNGKEEQAAQLSFVKVAPSLTCLRGTMGTPCAPQATPCVWMEHILNSMLVWFQDQRPACPLLQMDADALPCMPLPGQPFCLSTSTGVPRSPAMRATWCACRGFLRTQALASQMP